MDECPDEREQHEEPMGRNARQQSADGVREDGLGNQRTVAHRVEHGSVGAEITAPAHAHGGEDCDGVVVDDAFRNKARNQAQRCPHCS